MRKISLFAVLTLAFSLLVVAQPTDTIPEPRIELDSLTQHESWSVRSPLSEEEIQKREDNRARVARMKHRFRAFHNSEEKKRQQTEQEAADSDFLWSDAEEGGQTSPKAPVAKGEKPTVADESLRLEISRNLQYGKSGNTSPSSPVRPDLPQQSYPAPEAYHQIPEPRINTNTAEMQRDIKSAFQTNEVVTIEPDQEQLNSLPGIAEAFTYTELSTGQSYLLGVSFVAQQYTLQADSYAQMDLWADWLKQHPGLRIELRAYLHHEMDELSAIDLSIQRAKTVADYWLAQGVLAQQIAYRGYGSLSPLVPSTDPGAKQKNERIEVIILELPKR